MPTTPRNKAADAFAAQDAQAGDDPFMAAGAAPKSGFPTMAQLTSGAERRQVTYAKGDSENEQVLPSSGRLVMLTPRKVERQVASNFENQGPSDRWTCDVVVFDGEPITEKLDKEGDTVFEFPEPLTPPFVLKGMYISSTVIGAQFDKSVIKNGGKLGFKLLGRLMRLPASGKKGKPYAIGDYTPEEAKMASAYVKAHPEPDAFDA